MTQQQTLARPVCGAPFPKSVIVCVLLLNHTGPHVSSNGRSWK